MPTHLKSKQTMPFLCLVIVSEQKLYLPISLYFNLLILKGARNNLL